MVDLFFAPTEDLPIFCCHPGARGVLNHLNQPKPTILSQPLISLHIVWPAKIRDRLMHSP